MKKLGSSCVIMLAFLTGQFSSVAGLSGGSVEELAKCTGETATLTCDSAEPAETCDNSVEYKGSASTPEIQMLHKVDGEEVNTCEKKNPSKMGCTGSGPKPTSACTRPVLVEIEAF